MGKKDSSNAPAPTEQPSGVRWSQLLLVPIFFCFFAAAYYLSVITQPGTKESVGWLPFFPPPPSEHKDVKLPRDKRDWPKKKSPRLFKAKLLREYLHNPHDFTQGFEFGPDGNLWQSTGLYRQSKLQKFASYNATKGEFVTLKPQLFGEGITFYREKIFQLTWRENVVLVYDHPAGKPDVWKKETPRELELPRPIREGWGISNTGTNEWMLVTDGSHRLYWVDGETFKVHKSVEVQIFGSSRRKLNNLNELEYDPQTGLLYANVWFDKNIYIIHPESGIVIGMIDCASIFPRGIVRDNNAVLNGIALTKDRTLLITGKLWPANLEIELPDPNLKKTKVIP